MDRAGAAAGSPIGSSAAPSAVRCWRTCSAYSGYSRAQVTRLVSRWTIGQPLAKNYRRPEHAFARRYTAADVAAAGARWTARWARCRGRPRLRVLRRQRDVFKVPGFSSGWPTSLWRTCTTCALCADKPGAARGADHKTRSTRRVDIGVRRAPAPEGRAGFIRIDSVHQGDFDGSRGPLPHQRGGLPHPVAGGGQRADAVRGTPAAGDRADARAVSLRDPGVPRRQPKGQGPRPQCSEYVNHLVARLLDKLRIEFTRSRPRHSSRQRLGRTQERRRRPK